MDIDIEEQYEGLTCKLKEHVPFKVVPTRDLVQELRKKGIAITLKTELVITSVFNSSDITGIVCAAEEGEDVLACALNNMISFNGKFYAVTANNLSSFSLKSTIPVLS